MDKISHGEILKKIWKHLQMGAEKRNHPFHTPVLATVSENNLPSARIVVLRRFIKDERALIFHSHIGAPKIKEIQNNPIVSFVFYHPQEKIQLRVTATSSIHTNDSIAEEQWQRTQLLSRRCYLGLPPSQICENPAPGFPEEFVNRKPSIEETVIGRKNFAAILSIINSIDCLELNVHGHRRSLFLWGENNSLQTKWLTP
ncbi:MAG: pyridoxamine 5'-phosphate oxidase family protein [Acidobacteriota bacterium]|nr:pyridoxamine 5'-phosphate oxidase family protein [Acidobacteriota bacterium]